MTSLPYLSSETHTQYTLLLTINYPAAHSVCIMFTHRDGDIEMSDNTSYGTTHHIYATSTDESHYEDINKL